VITVPANTLFFLVLLKDVGEKADFQGGRVAEYGAGRGRRGRAASIDARTSRTDRTEG
jgi:hypothetical protein